ncbi:MAG: protein kinase [Planctomycetales bacterium]|nr:protein kinase [Planctomycetales bacterium]
MFRARDPSLGRDIALKILPAEAPADLRARFLREGRVAARLRHPNAVAVHAAGEADGVAWIAQDLIEGESLSALLDRESLPPDRAARLVEKVARALTHAHAQGVIHRDVKPANILLDKDGEPLLADFGLARDVEGSARLSKSGQVLGTPHYMSPEQAAGGPVDARTDVWACGVVLYECLSGAMPFDGETPIQVLAAVATREPRPLGRMVAGLPRDLDTIVAKCLEKDAARRYPTAEALGDDLGRFLRGDGIVARAPGALERLGRWARQRQAAVATAVLVLAASGAAVGGLLMPRWLSDARARADAETRERAALEARARETEMRLAAQPHVDRGAAVLGRLDRLLARDDWLVADRDALAAEARTAFQEALRAYPEMPEALLGMARAWRDVGNAPEALAWCTRAVEVAPRFAPARLERALLRLEAYARGMVAGEIGKTRGEGTAPLRDDRRTAEADLAAIGEAAGDEAGFARGLLAYARGDFASSGDVLEALARARRTDPRVWYWAGSALLHAGEAGRAAAAFGEALRGRPRDVAAWGHRGIARKAQGDIAGAIADYGRALDLAPQYVEGWHNRGVARQAHGDFGGAIADFDRALELDPRYAKAWCNRGNTRWAQGDSAGAAADFVKALEFAPAGWPHRAAVEQALSQARAAAGVR